MRLGLLALTVLAAGCVRTYQVAEGTPHADVEIEIAHTQPVPGNALVHDAVVVDDALVLESSERATNVFGMRVLPRRTHYVFGTWIERPCLAPPAGTASFTRDPIYLGDSDRCIARRSRDGSSRARGLEVLSQCDAEMFQMPVAGASYRIRYDVRGDRACSVTCERLFASGPSVACSTDERARD
jgi:hypothetical protein